jgi:hypothetical protein
MAFSYGFYDSLNHDRTYNATQLSMIFDGIISDGVYATIGNSFIVKASSLKNSIIVQSGRAWFNHTWNYNDADTILSGAEPSNAILPRIDAVVIDINRNEAYRENSIMWVTGAAASSPSRPSMLSTTDHFQYPLCYVYRRANNDVIRQEDITNMVGTSECPFVTGVIETVDTDSLILQWQSQWKQFMVDYEDNATDWINNQEADFTNFYNKFKNEMTSFETSSNTEFDEWFAKVKDVLDNNTAGKLQNEIDELTEKEFNYYYGLINTSTVIDDTTDTIVTTSDEATITTIFYTAELSDSSNSSMQDSSGNDLTSEYEDIINTTIVPKIGNYNYIRTTTMTPTSTGDRIDTTYIRKGK